MLIFGNSKGKCEIRVGVKLEKNLEEFGVRVKTLFRPVWAEAV